MNGQRVVEPEYLFFQAERGKKFITGSEAVKEAVKRANVDMAVSYPITPQSESMHLVGDIYAEGYLREYFRGENEFAGCLRWPEPPWVGYGSSPPQAGRERCGLLKYSRRGPAQGYPSFVLL